MSRSLRRGALAAAIVLSIAPLTAACGAGFDAQTGGVNPRNATVRVDDIQIQNVNIVMSEESDGPASVSARLFNDGSEEQTLEAIVLADTGQEIQLVPAEGDSRIVLPPRGSVALGGEGNAAAVIEDAEAAGVALGNAQHLVFDLSESGRAELYARVVPADGHWQHYQEWGPSPSPETGQGAGQDTEDAREDEDGVESDGSDTGTDQPGTDEDAGEEGTEGARDEDTSEDDTESGD
ncbi:lipoprotein [Streptomyces sodiiphilus]|uniref:Lipoprotein n=1 Tax=Streptomyces sodiiphilus TaxID=226217 RepID=A0ABP5A1T2_9ACTN